HRWRRADSRRCLAWCSWRDYQGPYGGWKEAARREGESTRRNRRLVTVLAVDYPFVVGTSAVCSVSHRLCVAILIVLHADRARVAASSVDAIVPYRHMVGSLQTCRDFYSPLIQTVGRFVDCQSRL